MTTASLFEPQPRLTDDLHGVVPTWRPAEQPIHDQLVADWPALWARLCAPVTDAPTAGVVVAGVVLDGPPTVALTVVPAVAIDLPGVDAPTDEFPALLGGAR